jgi:hypothetical protein
MAEQLNLSRGACRCLEELLKCGGKVGRCFPYQQTLATRLGRDIRTVRRYISELIRTKHLQVIKRQRFSSEYVLSETLKMSGLDVRSKAPSISVYKTLNTEGRKLHAREAERKPVGKELIPSVSNEEYIEFCTHCARERIQVPSRFEAAQIRQRFVGTFNGRPAWLQLKAFWNQRTVGYWLLKDREQVLMEMERQLLTPPEQSKNDKRREQVLRKLMEG